MTKIYCFVNSGKGTDWQAVMAMAEDGKVVGNHISSSKGWAKHDIGITSDWKHDDYQKNYPEGYELIWLDNPETSEELKLAYEKNQERRIAFGAKNGK